MLQSPARLVEGNKTFSKNVSYFLSFFSRRAQERGNNSKQTCGKKNTPEMGKRGYLLKVIFREVIII
jgi:hypothetical protein